MLAPAYFNCKAMQQLLLYYLEDCIDEQANDFRRLVITRCRVREIIFFEDG